jgi:hypothetical protein
VDGREYMTGMLTAISFALGLRIGNPGARQAAVAAPKVHSMLSRFRALIPGSRPEADCFRGQPVNVMEFQMNRTFSAIALQSAIAAAIIAAAPLASAQQWTEPQLPAFTGSTVSRAEVRQAAIEARDARQRMAYNGETAADPTSAPFVSTVSRKQVHAEAVEATRLGVTSSYDGKRNISAEQLAQIRNAGLRAVQAQDVVATVKQ